MTTAAAIYTRISLDKTGEGFGVQRQEDECRVLADRLGLYVTDVFSDNDISATTGKRRPGFEALLSSKPTAVIAWHQDRLLRLGADLERVIALDVPVYTVTAGTLDLTTPAGRAVARTVAAWSQYEGEQKSERQKAALRQRAARGDAWWTRVPFGYHADTTVNDEEAALIRKAYEDILNGKSAHAIAKEWTKAGVRLPGKKQRWEGRRITMLLANARNAGFSTYHGQIVGKAKWQPLVDEDVYLAVKAILSDPARRVGGAPKFSLLSGVLRCERCDVPMNRWRGALPSGRSFDRYRCNSCTFIVDAQWAEELVVDQILRWQSFRGEEGTAETVDHTDEIERLSGRLQDLATAYADDSITLVQLQTATKAIETKIEAIRQKQAEAAQATYRLDDNEIRERWDSLSTDERRQVIQERWTLWADYEIGSPKGRLSRKRIMWCRVGQTERLDNIAPRRFPHDAFVSTHTAD